VNVPTFTIAVFPFLKTSHPVQIGGYTFRSTSEVDALPADQAAAVREIADMLFLRDDLRIKSSSYAIVPFINIHSPNEHFYRLAFLRDALTCFYSAPNSPGGELFLTADEVSLVLFNADRVSMFLVRQTHHAELIPGAPELSPDQHGYVPGYYGVYNLKNHFWAARGSRLYGPRPHMTLVMAQDLYADLTYRIPPDHEFHLLFDLVDKPLTPFKNRLNTALHWFSVATAHDSTPHLSLLGLAIAFEALLRLPQAAKAERLVDAIALLLGRVERLDHWAAQFYAARSNVAHEGFASDHYFYIPAKTKGQQPEQRSGPLLIHGRLIFQLCLFAILVGAKLAERGGLRERFINNNERYEQICRIFDKSTDNPQACLLECAPVVAALELYRFAPGGPVQPASAISAIRRACIALLVAGTSVAEVLKKAIEKVAATKRSDSDLEQIEAIYQLHQLLQHEDLSTASAEDRVVTTLAEVAWTNLFDHYMRLRFAAEQTSAEAPGRT